ncbi:hypothetical protein Tco_0012352 [Tanacetum coccineum]
MANLKFVDQHNMVDYLEKSDENIEFHQIVDFFSSCSINYALTVSPTIYASYIEQFWNTATSKTINSVKQIHNIIDGKAVVISESLVRSDLLFDDEDGITCLTNDEIFENLELMGYEKLSIKLTFQKGPKLSVRLVVPLNLKEIEVSIRRGDNVERAITTDSSLVAAQDSGSPRRQETMGGTPAQTRSERVLEKPSELLVPEGHTSGSREVLDLETEKDAQAVEILKLKKRVKKLKRQRKSSISHSRRRTYRKVESSDDDLDEDDASKQRRSSDKTKQIFQDSNFDDLDDDLENVVEETVIAATTGGSTVSAPVTTAGVAISTAEPRTNPTITVFDDEDVTMAMA